MRWCRVRFVRYYVTLHVRLRYCPVPLLRLFATVCLRLVTDRCFALPPRCRWVRVRYRCHVPRLYLYVYHTYIPTFSDWFDFVARTRGLILLRYILRTATFFATLPVAPRVTCCGATVHFMPFTFCRIWMNLPIRFTHVYTVHHACVCRTAVLYRALRCVSWFAVCRHAADGLHCRRYLPHVCHGFCICAGCLYATVCPHVVAVPAALRTFGFYRCCRYLVVPVHTYRICGFTCRICWLRITDFTPWFGISYRRIVAHVPFCLISAFAFATYTHCVRTVTCCTFGSFCTVVTDCWLRSLPR